MSRLVAIKSRLTALVGHREYRVLVMPWGSVCLLALLYPVVMLWTPSVGPLLPGDMNLGELGIQDPVPNATSFDFVSRPLFIRGRKPPEKDQDKVVSNEALKEVETPLKPLEGFQLLGVFATDDAAGAIVLDASGERTRVKVGQSTGDLKLEEVAERSVVFSAASGERFLLEMAIITSLPPSAVVSAPEQNKGPDAEPSGFNEAGVVTFESIDARNRARAQKE